MLHPGADIQRRGNVSTTRELQVCTGIGFNFNGLHLSLQYALLFQAGVLQVEADENKSSMGAELNKSRVGTKDE